MPIFMRGHLSVAHNPLLVRVTTTAETVVWSEFEQPHRRGRWSYEKLGPFIFDQRQYELAIETVSQAA
jgi:hypothetical protein